MDKFLKYCAVLIKLSFLLTVLGFACDYVVPLFFHVAMLNKITAIAMGVFAYSLFVYLLFLGAIYVHRLLSQRKLINKGKHGFNA